MTYRVIYGYDIYNPHHTLTLTEALRYGYSLLKDNPKGGVMIKKPKSRSTWDYRMFRDYIGASPRTFVEDGRGNIHTVTRTGLKGRRVYMIVGIVKGQNHVTFTTMKPEDR